MTSTSSADRALLASSAVIATLAVVARIHDVAAYPAMYDYDASGHAVNVIDLLEGHLSNVRSWCGNHPPLYYALGAILWSILPDGIPVHVMLRSLSAAAWVATVGIVWRSLRRLGSAVDAAIVAAVLLSVPGLVIASCMMTNDTLCALFVTATLARLLEAPGNGELPIRHAASTGMLAGAAALAKATGVIVAGFAVVFYAWRSRRRPSRVWRGASAVALVCVAIAGPHYVRLLSSLGGSPFQIFAGVAGSREKDAIAAFVLALSPHPTLFPASVALFHEAVWGDPTAVFLPRDPRMPLVALSWAGLVVAAVAVAGAVRLLVRRELARRVGVVLLFGLLYAGPFLALIVAGPTRYFALTKMNLLLPEVLPVGIVLAVGLAAMRGGFGTGLRAGLLVIAAGGVASTWYGWWDASRSVPGPTTPRAEQASAIAAVDHYFEYRAHDPIRALQLLAPQVQMAHELRLVRILGVPLDPSPGLAPDAERSLELARARVAWLELYNLIRWMQPVAAALDVRLLEVNERRDTTDVKVRMGPMGATPPVEASGLGLWPFPEFDQRFTLERAGHEWRIIDVAQSDVTDGNAVQAFVAHPTLAAFEHLRALGWRPSWEEAVMSMGRPGR